MPPENTLTGDSSLIQPGFKNPPENPLELFSSWVKQTEDLQIPEARGFTLCTADKEGTPSSRILLMKDFDNTGIIFCTSSLSPKGLEMQENPKVAGTFWWKETLQQINFKGTATSLSESDSDQLFQGRVRSAQAIASFSRQSQPLEDEPDFRKKVESMVESHQAIARPENWSGYHCKFTQVEFWVGSKDRFHERLKYTLDKGVWKKVQLQP